MKKTLLSLAFAASAALLQAQESSPQPASTPLPAVTASSEPSPQPAAKRPHGRRHLLTPLFVALDANKDGVISQEELSAATTSLKTLDQNNDGKLSREESFRLNPPQKNGRTGGPDQRNGEDGPRHEGRPPREDGPRHEGRPPREDGPRSRREEPQSPPAGER